MDGCWKAWELGCVVDWGAVGALGTLAAVLVALWLAFRDARERQVRQREATGVLASSMQIRLGALVMGVMELRSLAQVFADYDPNPSQLQRMVQVANENAALLTREEAVALVGVAPELAGSLMAGIEGVGSLSRYMTLTAESYAAPENAEIRRNAMKVAGSLADDVLKQLRTATKLCRDATTHPLRLYKEEWMD